MTKSKVRFNGNGYDYFEKALISFRADRTYNLLFNYVDIDLSLLPGMLEQYVSKRMDISTFELKDYEYKDGDCKEIRELLASAHLYYKHEFMDVFVNAIGEYLNDLRIYTSYMEDSLDHEYDESLYNQRFKALTAPFSAVEDKCLEDFYKKYLYRVGDVIKVGPIDQPAQGFKSELQTQEKIKRMLYWVLDISAPHISDLTIPQRACLYGNMYESSGSSGMAVTKYLSLNSIPFLYRGNHDHSSDVELVQETNNIFDPLRASSFHSDYDSNHPNDLDALNRAIEYVKTNPPGAVYEDYSVSNLHQLLYLEVLKMMQASTNIRRCKHCGKYFVAENRKIMYCNNITRGETEPCFIIGPAHSYKKKVDKSEELKSYNRAYKTRHARIRKGRITEAEFTTWCVEAKEMLRKTEAKEIDTPTFEAWLKL